MNPHRIRVFSSEENSLRSVAMTFSPFWVYPDSHSGNVHVRLRRNASTYNSFSNPSFDFST